MKSKVLLRIASILMFLHDVGHTMGASSWKQSPDASKQEVIKQMIDKRFPFMGAVHSMADYYDGYGFASTLALLLFAIVLWLLSGSMDKDPALVKRILVTFAGIFLGWGIIELIYFFPFAAAFTLLAMLLIVISVFGLKKAE